MNRSIQIRIRLNAEPSPDGSAKNAQSHRCIATKAIMTQGPWATRVDRRATNGMRSPRCTATKAKLMQDQLATHVSRTAKSSRLRSLNATVKARGATSNSPVCTPRKRSLCIVTGFVPMPCASTTSSAMRGPSVASKHTKQTLPATSSTTMRLTAACLHNVVT